MPRSSTRQPRQTAIHQRLTLSAVLLMLLSWHCQAEEGTLAHSVEAFLYKQVQHQGKDVQIEVFPPSASLGACAQPAPFLPRPVNGGLSGRVSVGVRCNGEQHNVRYLTADIGVIGQYVQTTVAIERGTVIRADMLGSARGDLSRLPPMTITDPANAIGQVATRSLGAGSMLRSHDLQSVKLVQRGQEVSIESRGQGFVVTRRGESLDQGALGDSVRIRISRQEHIQALVAGPARVRIP